jgi:hypothetical protein
MSFPTPFLKTQIHFRIRPRRRNNTVKGYYRSVFHVVFLPLSTGINFYQVQERLKEPPMP